MTPKSVRVTGWGMYAPERRLTNADLERVVDTSDEWIVSRTGIRERRIAARNETTATLAAIAGKRAIAVAGLEPDDIDVILVATLTPDYWMPSTGALVKEAIGNTRAAAMDIAAACSGLVYAYSIADAYLRTGMFKNALVVGSEVLSRYLDFSDRGTCILFGDGAGAVVLSASDEEGGGMQGLELTTDPDGAYMIWLPSGGSRSPASGQTLARGEHYVRMEGRETYRYATKTMATTALKAIERAGWQPDEIDLFIPHQANVRIIEATAKHANISMDKVYVNVDRYGNTSSASIPIALDEAIESGRVKEGTTALFVAFGAGFTWGSMVARF
jgi:3-oxoacyl-[acyl-carrier-protein] synthase-3